MTDKQQDSDSKTEEKSLTLFNIENPFNDSQYLRDLLSLPAIMTYLGTAVSIYSILNNNSQLAFSLLGLIIIILFWTAINTHVRLKRVKNCAAQLIKEINATKASLSSIEIKYDEQVRSLAEDMHRLVHKAGPPHSANITAESPAFSFGYRHPRRPACA